MGPNVTKEDKIGSNGAKWGQTESNGQSNRANGNKLGRMGLNRAKQGSFFSCKNIFMRGKIMFSNSGPQTKIGRAMATLLFSWIS